MTAGSPRWPSLSRSNGHGVGQVPRNEQQDAAHLARRRPGSAFRPPSARANTFVSFIHFQEGSPL